MHCPAKMRPKLSISHIVHYVVQLGCSKQMVFLLHFQMSKHSRLGYPSVAWIFQLAVFLIVPASIFLVLGSDIPEKKNLEFFFGFLMPKIFGKNFNKALASYSTIFYLISGISLFITK